MGTDRRSSCPLVHALDILGDRWTLLVVRDLVFKRRQHYQQFLEAGEGISTNILADRLARLCDAGIVTKVPDSTHGKRFIYALTEKGKALAPVMLELIAWSHDHDPETKVPASYVTRIRAQRGELLDELWAEPETEI